MAASTPYSTDQLTRFAEATVSCLHSPIAILDKGLKVLAASAPFCRLLGISGDPRGKDFLSLNDGRWDLSELRNCLEAVLTEHRSFDDARVAGSSGGTLFISGRALHTDDEEPLLITLSVELAPSSVHTVEQLERGIAEEIVATIREPLLVLDYEHRVKLANDSFYRAFRVSPAEVVGQSLSKLGNGQWDIPELRDQLEALLRRDRYFQDFEVEHEFAEIGRRTMLLNARRIDHLRLILLAIEDVTERRRNERQQKLLVSELAHRVQNLLAVVQSLASQTHGATVDEFRTAFLGRLRALATSHGALFESRWRNAELNSLLRQILAPHAQRFILEGPPVTLSAEQAVAIGLIAHELATNAAKYGAFSTEAGRVSVSWGSKSATLWLEWNESGGPEVKSTHPPSFGVNLINTTASHQLQGNAELSFGRTGLRFRLQCPLKSEPVREPFY